MGKYNACLQSLLSGMHIIRTYCCWPFAQKTYGKAHEGVTKCEFRMLRYYMAVEGAMAFLQISKSATILLLGLFLVIKGDVAIGSLFAVIQLADLLSNPIEYLASLRYARNMMVPLVEKYISSIEESGPVRGEAASAEPLSSLAVEHVSCHAGGLEILKDVSAVFTGRKKYLIEGRSGSGKSTLLQLIGRSSELEYSGKILYNGGDAAALSCEAYWARVCQVFQTPYLFLATLEENILMGCSVSRDDYEEIIQKLNLGYLLERCKDKELTPEMVDVLSGGERQRIALARAMVGKPEAYLLDEVTSALDADTSEAVEALLLKEDALMIHICHKPNPRLRERYDCIFKMADGVLYAG